MRSRGSSPALGNVSARYSRSPHGEFPEYHTSADDLSLVTPDALAGSYATLLAIVDALESNRRCVNLFPKGEPQLGRRGLYDAIGGTSDRTREMALLWTLNLSDGEQSLLDIARRGGLSFDAVRDAACTLESHGLLATCSAA
jgi:aminopeptidase-like protein